MMTADVAQVHLTELLTVPTVRQTVLTRLLTVLAARLTAIIRLLTVLTACQTVLIRLLTVPLAVLLTAAQTVLQTMHRAKLLTAIMYQILPIQAAVMYHVRIVPTTTHQMCVI